MQFVKIGENQVNVVQRVPALRMARDFDHLPRFEFGIGIFGQFITFFLQASDFFRDIDRRVALYQAQFFDFAF